MLHTSHRRGRIVLGPFTMSADEADEIADRLKYHVSEARNYHVVQCPPDGPHLGPFMDGPGRAYRVCKTCGDLLDVED